MPTDRLRVRTLLPVVMACLIWGLVATGCSLGPSYQEEDGPRLARYERALFGYENDLEYVCEDKPKLRRKARAEARRLEALLGSKPNHLFRMKVASSDEPGDLDKDVTVREYATLSRNLLRGQAARSRPRSQCFRRHAAQLDRAIANSR